MYLIHGPLGGRQARLDSWKAIVEAKAEGKVRSIGVSNFGIKHIEEMIDAGVETPAINQVLTTTPLGDATNEVHTRLICILS